MNQIRRCILCYKQKQQKEMMRLICNADKCLTYPLQGSALCKKRGYYICFDVVHLKNVNLMQKRKIAPETINYICQLIKTKFN